jgi:hypothetical protein
MSKSEKKPDLSRRLFLLGAFSLPVCGIGVLLFGPERKESSLENKVKNDYSAEENQLYHAAVANIDARQAYLENALKEFGGSEFADIVYDHDNSRLWDFTIQRQNVTYDVFVNHDGSLEIRDVIRRPFTDAELAIIKKDKHDAFMNTAVLPESIAQRKKTLIFVFKDYFTPIARVSAHTRRVFAESALKHEICHAKDYFFGIDLGDGLFIDAKVGALLSNLQILGPILEARGYRVQLEDCTARIGGQPEGWVGKYVKHVRLLEARSVNYPDYLRGFPLRKLINRVLETEYGHPVLGRFLRKQ